jgi:GNAT superfamily N-acetyltransferase
MMARASSHTTWRHRLAANIEISAATPTDAGDIADIHLAARGAAMPYLHRPFTDAETRDWFASVVGDQSGKWWVARCGGRVAGYLMLDRQDLDHLYVHPAWQGRGVGTALLNHAKACNQHRLILWTFQRNANARSFYEAHGFRSAAVTDGQNQEHEPDVQYVWEPSSHR